MTFALQRRLRWASAMASVVALAAGTLVAACSSESTGGRRVTLHTRLELDDSASSPFTTALGWNVTVDKALLATGAFYYFDGTPPSVWQPRRQSWKFATRLLGLGVAHAHPNHYAAGDALGEMLEESSVDLLGSAVDLPDGDGVTGTYRSARFTLGLLQVGPVASALAGHVALVEGHAEKAGEEPRFFRASADQVDLAQNVTDGQIDGCEFTPVDIRTDGTVTVRVKLNLWFNLVDFAELEPGSVDAPSEFPTDSQPRVAFAQDLTQLSAYKFSYLPD